MYMTNENPDLIMVSIYCLVYNHEPYLRKCFDGFITQKTNFNFEIIVHDDASTDNSAEIIREYAEKYPDIFVPIYQTENQYSKDLPGGIFKQFIRNRIRGKYVAICEGDDYWIHESKLQTQVDYLEEHAECTFCFTNAILYDMKTKMERIMMPYCDNDKELMEKENFNLADLASLSFIPTASFILRRKNYDEFPECFDEFCFCGDRKISLYSTALGYAHFINVPTCVYNYNVSNSAMSRDKSIRQQIKINTSIINMYNNIDAFTHQKYHACFQLLSFPKYKELLQTGVKKKEMDSEVFVKAYKTLSLRQKLKRKVILLFGEKIAEKLIRLKNKIK